MTARSPQTRMTPLLRLGAVSMLVCSAALRTGHAQTTLTPGTSAVQSDVAAPTQLHIDILEGEGALNNIRERTAREPVVQVEDQNHKPVAGVLLLFTLHDGVGGAGATVNGLSTYSTVTGADGRAQLHGLQLNATPGNYTITVTATLGTVVAETTIHESNVLPSSEPESNARSSTRSAVHKSSLGRNLLYFGGAAAAVTLIAVLGRQHGTTITAGTGTVHP